MRLQISRNSEVPIREQLLTQITLGIASEELKAGERLPSTRELARRLKIHPNTVLAAYRVLERSGWVTFRKGSGVYVPSRSEDLPLGEDLELDHLISAFLKMARSRGFSLQEIRGRVQMWLELQPPDRFLLIEDDADLREILIAEIRHATAFPVSGTDTRNACAAEVWAHATPLALLTRTDEVRGLLPKDVTCIFLRTRSISEEAELVRRLAPDSLVVVASRSWEFLRQAHSVLVAWGLDPARISLRNAKEPGWRSGFGHLSQDTLMIADTLVAARIPTHCRLHVFRLIADGAMEELRSFVNRFLS